MVWGKLPLRPILFGAQVVLRLKVTPEHVPAPPAFQTDNVSRPKGLPDRDGGVLGRRFRFLAKR